VTDAKILVLLAVLQPAEAKTKIVFPKLRNPLETTGLKLSTKTGPKSKNCPIASLLIIGLMFSIYRWNMKDRNMKSTYPVAVSIAIILPAPPSALLESMRKCLRVRY
jgi:hypothetical protein